MSKDILRLTKNDSLNYNALVNYLLRIPVIRITNKSLNKRSIEDRPTNTIKINLARKQNFECLDCGVEFPFKNGVIKNSTVDHVIPYKYGGKTNSNNLVLLCEECNQKRQFKYNIQIIEDHYGKINLEDIPEIIGKEIRTEGMF